MRKLIFAGLACLATFGAVASAPQAVADPVDCSLVLCPTCPTGTVLSPTPGNCCRCVRA